MPLNESKGYSRSTLTKEQKRQAEAAIYGIDLDLQMEANQLTHEEIERMRAMIAQHDGASKQGRVNEFDLNNPPRVPYVHQDFPKIVYHHAKRIHKVVNSLAQLESAQAAGFQKEPYAADETDNAPELDAATLAETEAIDKQARTKKK